MSVRRFAAGLLGLALVLISTVGVVAQAPLGTATRPVDDPLFEVSSVVPETWQDFGNGTYTRGQPPQDVALIAIQSADAAADEVLQSLLPQLALTEIPDVTGEFSSDTFDWTLYAFEVTVGSIELRLELALAEFDGRTYLIILQSTPDEFDALREAVFVPALQATAPLEPQPTPDPSTFDYQIEEVTFPGGAEDVQLAGTLTLPPGPGPHPVVVTMSGSGPSDRDESLKPVTTLKPFALIADALTSAGVGVLRYDDRGVGESTGDYNSATVEELALDAVAAIDYLETRLDVDADRIGLLGHSEGGMYAAIIGASDPRVAFILGMAPAVVDGVDLLVAQNAALQEAAGASAQEVDAARAFATTALPAARDGDDETLEQAARDYFGGVWERLGPDAQAVAGDRDEFVQRQLELQLPVFRSEWFRSFLAYDAEQDWARVTVPVLGLFGARDAQVVSEQNEPALRAALKAAGNEDFETIVFPAANHLFQAAQTGAFGEYSSLAPEFTDGFLDTIVDWVTVHAGVSQ